MQIQLGKHKNLYFSIIISHKDSPVKNSLIDTDGKIKDEWLKLLKEFPDRFMIGSDEFHKTPKSMSRILHRSEDVINLLNQLPDDLAEKIGHENAVKVFNLE